MCIIYIIYYFIAESIIGKCLFSSSDISVHSYYMFYSIEQEFLL